MTITQLLGISPLENATGEFKIRLNHEDIEGWMKTVAGFSNASGGTSSTTPLTSISFPIL